MVNYLCISFDEGVQSNTIDFWIEEWVEHEVVKKIRLIHADNRNVVCQELNQSLLVLGVTIGDGVEAFVEK